MFLVLELGDLIWQDCWTAQEVMIIEVYVSEKRCG
jgi:hypothetical protein